MDAEKGLHRNIRTVFQSDERHWKRIFAKALVRPFALFAYEPIVQLLGVYMAFVYGVMYREYSLNTHSQQRLIIPDSVPYHDAYHLWSNIPRKAGHRGTTLLSTRRGTDWRITVECTYIRQGLCALQKQEWRSWATGVPIA